MDLISLVEFLLNVITFQKRNHFILIAKNSSTNQCIYLWWQPMAINFNGTSFEHFLNCTQLIF